MSSGGKSGSSASESYDYYASGAILVGRGPYTRLKSIERNSQIVWSGDVDLTTEPVPFVFTVEGYGVHRFYRGTESQDVDPLLAESGNDSGDDHPPMRGWAYLVLDDVLVGREITNLPDYKVEATREPVQSVITGDATKLDADRQANPACVTLELFSDDLVGLGITPARFHPTSWQAIANDALARANETYLSVYLNGQSDMRSIALDIMQLLQGWIRWRASDSTVEAGRWLLPEEIDPSSLTVVTADDLSDGERPKISPETWDDVFTTFTAKYVDRTRDYKSTPLKHDEPRALMARDYEPNEIDLTRPYVNREAQMDTHLKRWGKSNGLPGGNVTLVLRREKGLTIEPGQLVRVDIDPEPGETQIRQVCRVITVKIPYSGGVTLQLEYEKAIAPTSFTPTPDVPDEGTTPEIPEIVYARLFEVPPPLVGGVQYFVGILSVRPDPMVTDLGVCYDNDSGGDFPSVGSFRSYALRAKISSSYADSASGAVSIILLDTLNRELIASDPGDTAARNNDLLMIVCKAGSGVSVAMDGDGVAILEVFSVSALVSTGADALDVTAFRSRVGTKARSFAVDDEVWFIRRTALPTVLHGDFPAAAQLGSALYFKLQPSGPRGQRPLVDCSTLTFGYSTARAYAPKIDNPTPANDSGEDFISCSPGDTVSFIGTIVDADGNLNSVSVIRKKSDEPDFTVDTKTLNLSAAYSFNVPVIFAVAGSYLVTIRAKDATSQVTDLIRRVECGTSGGTKVATPVLSPDGGYGWSHDDDLFITISCATAGAAIEYTINSVGWTPYTGGFSIPYNQYGTFVEARATKSGLTDSDVITGWYSRINFN